MKNAFSVIAILCTTIISLISCSKNNNSPTSSSSSSSPNYVLDTNFLQGNWVVSDSAAKQSLTVYNLAADKTGAAYIATDKGIYRSIDNGTTWSLMNTTLGAQSVYSIAIDTINNYMYCTTLNGLMRSMDNGASWTKIDTGIYYDLNISANGTVYITSETNMNLYRSLQQGDSGTWSMADSGIPFDPGTTYINILSMASGRNGIEYAGTDQYLFHSTDNGTSWERSGSGTLPSRIFGALGADMNGNVFAGTDIQNGPPFTLYHSTDDGTSWTQALQVNDTYGRFVSISTLKGCVFAGTLTDVYASFDNGATWKTVDSIGLHVATQSFGGQISQLLVLPNGTLLLNISSTIYKLSRPIFKTT
jgi:photosystem II stability/assembly factor-like uncharacterized protein